MARTVRPNPPPHRATRAAWLSTLGRFLDEHAWLYYLGFSAIGGLWFSGFMLMTSGGSRLLTAVGGLLAFTGGMIEILLSRVLARWREDTPWLLRVWEEGVGGMVEYAPTTYRFFGAAAAGVGVGAIAWAAWPDGTVAVISGILACLAIWIWTWFAFSEMEE